MNNELYPEFSLLPHNYFAFIAMLTKRLLVIKISELFIFSIKIFTAMPHFEFIAVRNLIDHFAAHTNIYPQKIKENFG